MSENHKNYAFIDSQNLNMATQNLGWNVNWQRFREFLRRDYNVDVAYMFIGFIPENQELYSSLQKAGYVLIFKPVHATRDGVKGNVDAELVLQAMADLENYDQAVVVSGDSDFYVLVRYLAEHNKLATLIVPDRRHFGQLLADAAKDKIVFLNNHRRQLEYKRGGQKRGQRNQSAAPETTRDSAAQ